MHLSSRRLFAIVISAVLTTPAAAQTITPAPQGTTAGWTFTVAPYLMAAGMSGTVGIKGYESDVDVSASDIFSHLKAGFMSYVGAKKNGWGIGLDAIYMNLGASVTQGPLTIEPGVKQGAYTFLASRQIARGTDLVFGARVNTITTTLAFTAPVQKELSGSKTWVDPVVGVNTALPLGEKAKVMVLANFGGFGAASTIAVDLFPNLQYRVAKHAWLAVGYRYIYTNYNDDAGFVYKMGNQGPAFGAVLPF